MEQKNDLPFQEKYNKIFSGMIVNLWPYWSEKPILSLVVKEDSVFSCFDCLCEGKIVKKRVDQIFFLEDNPTKDDDDYDFVISKTIITPKKNKIENAHMWKIDLS